MRYTLTKENLKKIGKGLLIAMGGAALTYTAELVPNVDFGEYTALVVAMSSVLINAAREWLKDR